MLQTGHAGRLTEALTRQSHMKSSICAILRTAGSRTSLANLRLMMAAVLLSGCAGHMNVSEKMMWSTYPLATQKGAATGFVINRKDARAPGGVLPVVFTSAHVLETVGRGPLIIGIRKLDENGEIQAALLAFNPPGARGKERFYVRHPQHDLAAFALHLPEEVAERAQMSSCVDQRMLAHDGKRLRSGVEVSFLGYPEVLPGTEGGFPVLRSGRVASYPVGTSQAHGRFLINADVYPGDSGAPVFVTQGGRPRLVGMISQRISPEERQFSHLAVAVDANVIRETMDLLMAAENKVAPVNKTTAKKAP